MLADPLPNDIEVLPSVDALHRACESDNPNNPASAVDDRDRRPTQGSVADNDNSRPTASDTRHPLADEAALFDESIDIWSSNVVPRQTSPSGRWWECPCGAGPQGQVNGSIPTGTIVSLREARCPFCGEAYREEYERCDRSPD